MQPLVHYSDSDGSEDGEEEENCGKRRSEREGCVMAQPPKRARRDEAPLEVPAAMGQPLPLPETIVNMFGGGTHCTCLSFSGRTIGDVSPTCGCWSHEHIHRLSNHRHCIPHSRLFPMENIRT